MKGQEDKARKAFQVFLLCIAVIKRIGTRKYLVLCQPLMKTVLLKQKCFEKKAVGSHPIISFFRNLHGSPVPTKLSLTLHPGIDKLL